MKRNLFEELKTYGESDFYPFHMPGHKRNPDSGFLPEMYKIDITEIDGFDNLYHAEGIIKNAQEKAASLYHSKETFYLINGSTVGILTSIAALSDRGKKLIMARNCHKAVYHGAFLNQLETEYIYPKMIEEFGISDGITAQQVEDKIQEIILREGISDEQAGKLIAGIVVTSPTYDGILSDVNSIVKIAHNYGIPVIVDQAHGAHFGFHSAFPENAVSDGADLVIHSTHKTLPAPTQTALLHYNSLLVSLETVKKYLRIYQSSSPSYVLMAGIDSCMDFVKREGQERLEQLLISRKELSERSKELKKMKIYPSMLERGINGHDINKIFFQGTEEPGRLLISVRGSGFTGQQLYDVLRETYHLQMEMCASDYVIAILSMMDRKEGFDRLWKALSETDKLLTNTEKNIKEEKTQFPEYCHFQPDAVLKISDAYMAEEESVPLREAKGRIVSEFVNLYPPGIPLLVPGEKIDDKMIPMIEAYLHNGYAVQGIERDGAKKEYCLKVIRQRDISN
ncbi:MAG: aminotransferase class I/II-fold pyridoxal phosphate-dependent enzyme [Lachnospiraceae bacterium]|nr:aminotransferase class I/II-fold pyridoxal phosphate-dependent enzyme [Lachnospiraceae bacterium]MDD7628933.1 aminotransferase class I/II-fold pyridoxal phosphate-dependent enzyme [Lachnospiraceae bacterium]MDY4117607.1 aminotransferase class I/II-fold pyridoxal phosphate-dependent enzyme [Lachnospiraceae bacterium]